MNIYQMGETVVLKATIKKSSVLYDPATSVLIYIYIKGTAAALTDGVAMIKESVGVYSYDYQTAALAAGDYRFRVKATDGTKISTKDGSFTLES